MCTSEKVRAQRPLFLRGLLLAVFALLLILSGCFNLARVDLYETLLLAENAPDIAVKQGSTELPDATGSYDFGSVEVYTTVSETFTIENSGGTTLTITGISLIAGDTTQFSIDASYLSSIVEPNESTTFIISFNPTDTGYKSATVSIENDDPDEDPYTFSVEGDAYGSVLLEPDIVVLQGAIELPDGTGSYDFGSVEVYESSSAVTFTIENTGTADLNISSVFLTAGDIYDFTIDTSTMVSTVEPTRSTSFTITFIPSSTGYRSATVSVDNDDPDENPYTFTVLGDGSLAPVSDISVRQGSTDIPSGTGGYDFGTVQVGASSSAVTFTIENSGTADLNITGVALASGNFTEFSIDISSMSSPVPPGTSTDFSITFSPTSEGDKSATVSIDNDDPDENPYTFTVKGTGATNPVPDINLKVSSTDYPNGSTYDFLDVSVGNSSSVVFTIENNGTADLDITNILLTSGDQYDFKLDLSSTTYTISPGGSTNFTVTFTPQDYGGRWRNLEINGNDPDESPYSINLVGFAD